MEFVIIGIDMYFSKKLSKPNALTLFFMRNQIDISMASMSIHFHLNVICHGEKFSWNQYLPIKLLPILNV